MSQYQCGDQPLSSPIHRRFAEPLPLTNYLMERMPIYQRISLTNITMRCPVLCGISPTFAGLFPSDR